MLDRGRLSKILAMTTSPNDAEALSALRKANEVLKGAGLTWNDVITPQNVVNISISRHSFAMPGLDRGDWAGPHIKRKT